jgi:hypothetical protein
VKVATALLLLAPLLVDCVPAHSLPLVRQCSALHAGMSLREAIAVVTVTRGHCFSPHKDAVGILRCIPERGGEPVRYYWDVQVIGAEPDECSVSVNRSGYIISDGQYHLGSGSD